ncbi:ribonuclease H-like domain-containing protein [Tanacetum coccineum]
MSLHGYSDGKFDDGSDVDNVTLISKLDVSHPLHLHPNDYVALTVVSVKLKGTENYQVWSCAMLLALEGKNKIGFIDGSFRRYNTDKVLGRQWDRVNAVVLGEESHRIATGSVSRTSQRSQTSAFNVNAPNRGNFQRSQTSTSFSRPFNNNRPNNNGNRRTVGGSTLVCENCGFNGHTIDRCFKIIGYPPDFEAFITKIGNMPLTDYLTLFDVLVVPKYCVSLMSVHKVARDSKLVIAFDELKCYILNQDLKVGKVLGTGRQFGGLYYFDGNQGRELKSSCINNVCLLSKYTWHCRLGHPANQVLNVLRPNLLFDNDKSDVICETCQRAKQNREPFPLSDHVSTEFGELVHLDL